MRLSGILLPISYGHVYSMVITSYLFSDFVGVWFPSLIGLSGSLVPISYGFVWQFGSHLLWCCVAVRSSQLTSYGVVWQFGPHCLSVMGLCGSLVPISYGHV